MRIMTERVRLRRCVYLLFPAIAITILALPVTQGIIVPKTQDEKSHVSFTSHLRGHPDPKLARDNPNVLKPILNSDSIDEIGRKLSKRGPMKTQHRDHVENKRPNEAVELVPGKGRSKHGGARVDEKSKLPVLETGKVQSVGGGTSGSKYPEPSGRRPPKTTQDKCTQGQDPDKPVPDYNTPLTDSYTLQLEMTEHVTNTTYYVIETREKNYMAHRGVDTVAVRITTNASQEVIYYYPPKKHFILYKDGACQDYGTESPSTAWGWFDQDIHHGGGHFGPSSILLLTHYELTEFFTTESAEYINDVLCEGWKMCASDGDVELYFHYSVPAWEMPATKMFGTNYTQFPVRFSTRKMDGSSYIDYSISQFLPFVVHHTELEPPRGANCEAAMAAMTDLFPIPSMPSHFSFQQEVISNPMIEGQQHGEQILDKSLLYYSQDLSLIRSDFTPATREETPFMSVHPLRVIKDYNTGVAYYIDLENGNCTRTWLTSETFDSHTHGFYGSGEMVGPNEFMKLTGPYAYMGPFNDRHLEDYRWTSTRDDIVNPATGTVYKKAVLEWEFMFLISDDVARGDNGGSDVPVRTNLFIYNQDDSSKIESAVTTNVYDYSAISLYSDDEFDVFQCYERKEYDWSFLLFMFPTNDQQFGAMKGSPDLVRHQLYEGIMKFGKVSPVRISNIDVTDGLSGMGGNHTNTKIVIASVRFLERAPYIYSYSLDDGAPSVPGQNEKKYANIDNPYECAEFCSRSIDIDCKSFQVCDSKDCYLSQYVEHDGDPVPDVTSCEHWVQTMANITFEDLPSNEAIENIQRAAHSGEFMLQLRYEDHEVDVKASEVFNYPNPDPMVVVTGQFLLVSRHSELKNPDTSFNDIATLEECESLCLNIQEYRCDSISYSWQSLSCHLSSLHFDAFKPEDIAPMSHSDILTRSYLTEYTPVFGGVSLNTSGPVYQGITNLETCAMKCSTETKIDCRSFDLCFEESTCRLHPEGFLEGTTGGDYNVLTTCTHFTRESRDDFTEYKNQALLSSQHQLVLSSTTAAICAKQCIDDTSEVCESFDFCEVCGEAQQLTCGSDGAGKVNACFLSTKHLGEEGVNISSIQGCQHYERDYFGDLTYSAWKNQQLHQNEGRYGPGAMAGLAFGMIFLGILMTVGFLYTMAYARRGNLPSMPMSFTNLRRKAGETKP